MSSNSKDLLNSFIRDPLNVHLIYTNHALVGYEGSSLEATIDSIAQYILENPLNVDEAGDLIDKIEHMQGPQPIALRLEKELLRTFTQMDLNRLVEKGSYLLVLKTIEAGFKKEHLGLLLTVFQHLSQQESVQPEELALSLEIIAKANCEDDEDRFFLLVKKMLKRFQGSFEIGEKAFSTLFETYCGDRHFQQLLISKMGDTREKTKALIFNATQDPYHKAKLLIELAEQKDFRSIIYLFANYKNDYSGKPLAQLIETTTDVELIRTLLSQPFIDVKTLSKLYLAALNNPTHKRELTALFVELGIPARINSLAKYLEEIMTQGLDPLFYHLFKGQALEAEPVCKEIFVFDEHSSIKKEYLSRILEYYSQKKLVSFLNSNLLERAFVLRTWSPDLIKLFVDPLQEEDLKILARNVNMSEAHVCYLLEVEKLSADQLVKLFSYTFSCTNFAFLEQLVLSHTEQFALWCQLPGHVMHVKVIQREDIFPVIYRLIQRVPKFIEVLKENENLIAALAHEPYPRGYLRKIVGEAPFPGIDPADFLLSKKNQVLDLIDQGGLFLEYEDGSNIFHKLAEMGFPLDALFEVIEELLSSPDYKVSKIHIQTMLNSLNPNSFTPFEVRLKESIAPISLEQLSQLEKYGYQFPLESVIPELIEQRQFDVLPFFGESASGVIQHYLDETNYVRILQNQVSFDVVADFKNVLQFGLTYGLAHGKRIWSILEKNLVSEDRALLSLLLKYPEQIQELFEVALQSPSAPTLISIIHENGLLDVYKHRLATLIMQPDHIKKVYLISVLHEEGIAWEELFEDPQEMLKSAVGLQDIWIDYLISKGYEFPLNLTFELFKQDPMAYQLIRSMLGAAIEKDASSFFKVFFKNLPQIAPRNLGNILMILTAEFFGPLEVAYNCADATERGLLFFHAVGLKKISGLLFDKLVQFYVEYWKKGEAGISLSTIIVAIAHFKEDFRPLYGINPTLFLTASVRAIFNATPEQVRVLFDFLESVARGAFIQAILASDLSIQERVEIMEKFVYCGNIPLLDRWVFKAQDHFEIFRFAIHRQGGVFFDQLIGYELQAHEKGAIKVLAEEFKKLPRTQVIFLLNKLSDVQRGILIEQLAKLDLTFPEISHVLFQIRSLFPSSVYIYLLKNWALYQDHNGDTLFIYAASQGKWELADGLMKIRNARLGGTNHQGYSALDYFFNTPNFSKLLNKFLAKGVYSLEDLRRSLYRVPPDQALHLIAECKSLDRLVDRDLIREMLANFLKETYSIRLPFVHTFADLERAAKQVQQVQESRYKIDPAHYAVEIPTVEIPTIDAERADHRLLIKLFEKFVPQDTVSSDGQVRLTYQDLQARLRALLDYIEREEQIAPLPIDRAERHQEYEKLKNIYRNLIVEWEQISDPEIIRSSLIEIAKGGPPYCATKWFTEAMFPLEQLLKGPDQQMTIDLEIHSMVAEFYRGVFFDLVQEINRGREPGNHLHTPVQLFYLLRPDPREAIAPEGRGIRLNQEAKEDVFGPNWTRRQAIDEYDKKCRPLTIIRMIQERLNSFDMPLIKKNLIEDWLVEHFFPADQFELSELENQNILETMHQVQQNRAKVTTVDRSVLEAVLDDEERDRSLLVEFLVDPFPELASNDWTSLSDKESFEVFMSALLFNTPYQGLEHEELLLENIRGTPGVNESIANWIFKGAMNRLKEKGGISTFEAAAQVNRLKIKWMEFLNDSAFRQAFFKDLATGNKNSLIDRFIELESLAGGEGALVGIIQNAEIPLTNERIKEWLLDPKSEILLEMMEKAVKIQKVQLVKEQLYEVYPLTGQLKHYDRNNFLIEERYQSLVLTRAHFKEEYIVLMLKYLRILKSS